MASSARAQQVPDASDDPVPKARFHFGVVAVNPRFGVKDVGFDSNVFNSPILPQQDFTTTIVPGAQFFLRTGKGLLTVDGELQAIHYNRFDSERSINSNATVRYELRFNRLRPYTSFRTLNTRERPGYEIDARARHYESDTHAGADLRVASKTTMRVDFRRRSYSFAPNALFFDLPLNEELNRDLTVVEVAWRQRLTALTTWVTRATRESERFQFSNIRNSNSLRFNTGFELGSLALIRGSAFVGYRKLQPTEGGQFREFSGITTDVNVSYTVPTQTRLSAVVSRDIQYSYERKTPYFVQTGWTAILTQRVVGRWDVQLQGGRDRLSYQALDLIDRRKDYVGRFGGGIGYALGENVRASFDVQSYYRSSVLRAREYGSLRSGFSVTYGT